MKRIVACAVAAALFSALVPTQVRAQVSLAQAPDITRLPLNSESRSFQFNHDLVVFHSKEFPKLSYNSRADAEGSIGPFKITTRYFNSAHQEVKEAAKVGRYGAIMETRDADDKVRDTRFITLYKEQIRKEVIPNTNSSDRPSAVYQLSENISPEQIKAQQPSVDEYRKLTQTFLSAPLTQGTPPSSWLSPAVLLAGLSESRAGDAPVQRLSVRERDRRWWYEQKKRLGMIAPYRHIVETPPGYATDGKKYPVLLFLHGSGERGLNVEQVRVHGPLRYIREGHPLPFIVVAPQCEPGERWLPERVMDLVADIEKKYRVDKDRIYLTGLSMGGYGTWATALEYPDRFAALLPICGGGDPLDANRIKDKPIWNFHGGADPTVPVARSIEMVNALRALDAPEVYFKIYPGVGHDSWTQTYNNPDIYTWLLSHRSH